MKSRATWTAQYKLNGQRNVIYIDPDLNIQWWNRHQENHRNYTPPKWLEDQIREVVKPTGKWVAIDGELLHAKDATIKNTLYWWDVLVHDNEQMLGTSGQERLELLYSLTQQGGKLSENETADKIADRLTDNIWLARNIKPDRYDESWKLTEVSYVEGFMFKDMKARLKPMLTEKNNSEWMVRCRKEHKGYQF